MAKDSLEMEGREGSWRGYISPGLLAADMSQLLREAWVRCRNLGVDPAGGRCRRLLSKPEFAPYLAENRLLVKTAAAIFQESSDLTGSFPVAMFIATEDGIILETFGDTKIRRVLAAELNLVPGACWREEETGNTALSMARAIREPVQVTGTEHYCRCYYPWSDAAAPLFSPEGQVAGLLGLFIPAEEAHPGIFWEWGPPPPPGGWGGEGGRGARGGATAEGREPPLSFFLVPSPPPPPRGRAVFI